MRFIVFLFVLFMSFSGVSQLNYFKVDTLLYKSPKKYKLFCNKGIITQHNWETNAVEPIQGDSLLTFANVVFVNAGGQFETIYTNYPIERRRIFTGGTWYCLDRKTNRLIGSPYSVLGMFDQAGRAIAQKIGLVDYLGITNEGQEIKPNFHLASTPLLTKSVADTSFNALCQLIAQKGLLNNVNQNNHEQVVREKYQLDFYPFYDDYGNVSEDSIMLSVYLKSAYFNNTTYFPLDPIWEFNYADYYGSITPPNEKGWRWAIPNELIKAEDSYSKFNMLNAVLVNENGEVLTKSNYRPIPSPCLLSTISNAYFSWENFEANTQVIEQLQAVLPNAKGLSPQDFQRLYKDSLIFFVETQVEYDPDQFEESIIYHIEFYRKNILQHMMYPPPTDPQYHFHVSDRDAIEGTTGTEKNKGKHAKHPTKVNDIVLPDGRTINSFGTKKYAVVPLLNPELLRSEKYRELEVLKKTNPTPQIAEDFKRYAFFEKMIHYGFAKKFNYETESEEVMQLTSQIEIEAIVYEYVEDFGLAIDNRWELPQIYLSIAYDTNNMFILVDTNFNLSTFDLATKKITPFNTSRLQAKWNNHLVLQNLRDFTFTVYPIAGEELFPRSRQMNQPLRNIHHMHYLSNCDFISLKNKDGEDSLTMNENQEMFMVYFRYCDSAYYGGYSQIPTQEPNWLTLTNGNTINLYGELGPQFSTSREIKSRSIVLNDNAIEHLTINEDSLGLLLSMANGPAVRLAKQTYLDLISIQPGENGYGGFWKDKTFYSYQLLTPFPEKHKVHIHLFEGFWLVGSHKQLELIRINEQGVVSRYPAKFKNFEDYLFMLNQEETGENSIRAYFTNK